jgi:hypothetical protein
MPGAFTGSQLGAEMGFYHRLARGFTRIGCRVALLEAPLHGRRARPGERSGHDLLHGDLFTYVRGIAQAVRDVRAAIGWLHADIGPVGYWGLSLGGLVGAVAIVRDPRPAFTVLVQPPLGRDEAMQSVLTSVWREQLLASGVTPADINAAFDLLHTNDPPAPALASILIQAARYDTVASPRGITQTWERWGRPPISWYDHSHTSIFLAGDALIAEGVAFADRHLPPSRPAL